MKIGAIADKIIKSFLGPLWAVIKPAIIVLGSQAGRTALELATKFVAEAMETPELLASSGKARAGWVQAKIKEANIDTGNPLADSIINLAIEVAVQRYKASH
jgi:hypothetical protein